MHIIIIPLSGFDNHALAAVDVQSAVNLVHPLHESSHLVLSPGRVQRHGHVLNLLAQFLLLALKVLNDRPVFLGREHTSSWRSLIHFNLEKTAHNTHQ